jgi:hypothetical protein
VRPQVVVPAAPTSQAASLASQPVVGGCSGGCNLSFAFTGTTLSSGGLDVDWTPDGGSAWQPLADSRFAPLGLGAGGWQLAHFPLAGGAAVAVRFTCRGGAATSNFCALDAVSLTA